MYEDEENNKINENGETENDDSRTYDFKGPPKYVPQGYGRHGVPGGVIALVTALCVLFGGTGFAAGAMIASGRQSSAPENGSELDFSISDTSGAVRAPEDVSYGGGDFSLEAVSSGKYYTVPAVVEQTADTVVEIATETVTTGSFMQQYITSGAGSGVIISSDGYIATNNHVIEGATAITVRLKSGTEYSATLVGTDAETDVAVIKIDASGLKAATLGDSDSLRVGDSIIAIGNPLGELGGTVTEGIISSLSREITVDGQDMILLQHSAAVSPGNSGGGLFNMSGELIGIVNAKYSEDSAEGLGFAIPVSTASAIIEDLINFGYVRGRINWGVTALDIYTNINAYYYGVSEFGTYAYKITKNGDAANAGIVAGDRIDSVNGITIDSAETLQNILDGCKVGDTLTVNITRFTYSGRNATSEAKTITVVLTEYMAK